MPITIGSNILSLRAVGALSRVSANVATAFDRLSSGQRINRGSDDPAGLSVSTSLENKARILNRASLNISDGVSLLSIADSALGSASSVVTRMAELASQAANGTFSLQQRRSLNAEYQALDNELRRISNSTSFNGINLLSGNRSNASAQTVATTSSTASLVRTSSDGNYVSYVSGNTLSVMNTQNGTTNSVDTSSVSSIAGSVVLADGTVYFQAISNTDGSTEVYRFNPNKGALEKVTSSGDGGSMRFNVSADGRMLAYTFGDGSSANLSVMNLETGEIRTDARTLNTILDVNSITLSSDGEYVVLSGGIGGRLYSARTSNAQFATTATTFASGVQTQLGGITQDGKLYFVANSTGFGANPSAFNQIFSMDIGTSQISQLTSYTSNNTITNFGLSTDGGNIFFTSVSNVTGENSAGIRQVFNFDTNTRQTTQRTAFTTLLSMSTLSRDGGRAFGVQGTTSITSLDTSADASNFDFEVGQGTSGGIISSIASLGRTIRGLGSFWLTSASQGRGALDNAQGNLARIASLRGTIGASLARLEIANNLTRSQRDETIAAQSRIKDIDVATESSELIRNSILQQIGSSLLAQANQAPALALKLLTNAPTTL